MRYPYQIQGPMTLKSTHQIKITGLYRLLITAVFLLVCLTGYSQTTLSSLADLKAQLGTSNGNFKMAPGTYYFDKSNTGPGKLFGDEEILLFTGSNSTFDFTDVKFVFDTEALDDFTGWVVEFWPVGDSNVYLNLTMEDIGNNIVGRGGEAIHLDGADNRIEGFHITVRGSFPYGYGDIFGKGGGSVIGHQKHAGILVRGERNHVKNVTLLMRSYGHGIFMQGSQDALIEGCYVEGELRTVGEVLQEEGTGSPADNVGFMTVWGYDLRDLKHDYTFSLQEDGIRCYTSGTNYGDTESRNTTGTQIKNCTVIKMRSGVTIGWDYTDKVIENCKVLACETGYWVGSNTTVTGCSGDASIGPLISEDVGRSNSTIEMTLLDNFVPKIGNTPHFFFAGTDHELTLYDGTTSFDSDVVLQVGGSRQAHRWLEGSGEEPITRNATNLTFTNNTRYPVVLESNASSNTVRSCGPVTNRGSGNSVSQLSNCSYERACSNTLANLQAECFDAMSGIQKTAIGSNNEQAVADVQANDWIKFNGLDLTGIASVHATASAVVDGTTIEVRAGSTSGTLLATIPISNTSNLETFQTFSADLSETVNGSTDVVFVFNGGSGDLCNVDKLSFAYAPCFNVSYNPVMPISAESFCSSSGVNLEDRTTFNQVVTDISDGDYIGFANVAFGYNDRYNAVRFLVASEEGGGAIEVRSGAVDGKLLGSVDISKTGANTYKSFAAYIGAIEGTQDIYLVFKGSGASIMKVDNFYFLEDLCAGVAYDASKRLEAEDYCEMSGVQIIDHYLGNIQHGDWIRFGQVDFSTLSAYSVRLNLAGFSSEGHVDIRLGSPTAGELIATTHVSNPTNSWTNFKEVLVPLNQEVTGIHDVYIIFREAGNNIDWIQFSTTVVKQEQHIDFPALPAKFVNDEDFDPGASASSGLEITYTSSNEQVATVVGSMVSIVGVGSCVITAEQSGDVRFDPAPAVSQTLTVTKVPQVITFPDLPVKNVGDPDFSPEISVDSGMPITITSTNEEVAKIVDGKVRILEGGITTIVASQPGDEIFSAVEVSRNLVVLGSAVLTSEAKKEQVLIYPNPVTDVLYVALGHESHQSYKLTYINGQSVRKGIIRKHEMPFRIDISTLTEGIYFLHLLSDRVSPPVKILKK